MKTLSRLFLLLLLCTALDELEARQMIFENFVSEKPALQKSKTSEPAFITIGLKTGSNLSARTPDSTKNTFQEQVLLLGEYLFNPRANNFLHSLILESGYSKNPINLDYGSINSDFLTAALKYQLKVPLSIDYAFFAQTGGGIQKLLSYHYFSEEANKEYNLKINPIAPFVSLSLGLDYLLSSSQSLTLEIGAAHTLQSPYQNQTLYISADTPTAHDVVIKNQNQTTFYLNIGFKFSAF